MKTQVMSIVLVGIVLAGCQPSAPVAPPVAAATATPDPAPAPDDKEVAAALQAFRKPGYVVKEGREYGYEAAQSPEDQQKGLAGAPLQMYRYLGRVGDKYQVGVRKGDTVVVYEGAAPFEFVKAYAFVQDRLVDKQTMHLQRSAIAAIVLKDALYGNIEQYRGSRSGKNGHLMLDEEAGRIVFVADHS